VTEQLVVRGGALARRVVTTLQPVLDALRSAGVAVSG
jgi:hypothetical protein